MNRHLGISLITTVALIAPAAAYAQGGGRGTAVFHVGTTEILNVEPMENVPAIAGAPFSADATTEFSQMLSDGNRIERRFSTSLARDGKGRTRSEQDVAMLGPLVVLQKGMNWSTHTFSTTPGATGARGATVHSDHRSRRRRDLHARRADERGAPQSGENHRALRSTECAVHRTKEGRRQAGDGGTPGRNHEHLDRRATRNASDRRRYRRGHADDDYDSRRADRESESDQRGDRALVLEGSADGRCSSRAAIRARAIRFTA